MCVCACVCVCVCVCVRACVCVYVCEWVCDDEAHLRPSIEEVVVCDLDHGGRFSRAGTMNDEHPRVGQALRPAEERDALLIVSVSYTHLTLPTILLV